MAISAVVHTKNNQDTLARTLESLAFADEIVVVDMESADETKNIASKYTQKIFDHEDVGYVEPARNFGVQKTNHEWVLVVDADEVVPQKLAKKLKSLSDKEKVSWALPRKNIVFGQWVKHTNWWPDYNVRFFPKGKVTWSKQIHAQPEVEGKLKQFSASEEHALVHYHYESVNEWVERMNRYTSVSSNEKIGEDIDPDEVFKAFSDDFLRRYYEQEGYKDYEVGAYLSLLQGMYQFIEALKRRELAGFEHTNVNVDEWFDEFTQQARYWKASKNIQLARNPVTRWYWRLRRKFYI